MVAIKAVAHKLAHASYYVMRDRVAFDIQRAFADLYQPSDTLRVPMVFWGTASATGRVVYANGVTAMALSLMG